MEDQKVHKDRLEERKRERDVRKEGFVVLGLSRRVPRQIVLCVKENKENLREKKKRTKRGKTPRYYTDRTKEASGLLQVPGSSCTMVRSPHHTRQTQAERRCSRGRHSSRRRTRRGGSGSRPSVPGRGRNGGRSLLPPPASRGCSSGTSPARRHHIIAGAETGTGTSTSRGTINLQSHTTHTREREERDLVALDADLELAVFAPQLRRVCCEVADRLPLRPAPQRLLHLRAVQLLLRYSEKEKKSSSQSSGRKRS